MNEQNEMDPDAVKRLEKLYGKSGVAYYYGCGEVYGATKEQAIAQVNSLGLKLLNLEQRAGYWVAEVGR